MHNNYAVQLRTAVEEKPVRKNTSDKESER